MPIAPGETFERYAIESLIGRGGMGEVYRATDTRLRRKVALKVLRTDRERPDAVARLFREARAAASLSHPHTIAIHDLGESDDGTFYIVMELVTGSPLLAYVGDDRVPLSRKLGWLSGIAKALAAAHKAGVLHRDVKPSNVMVADDDVVKVLDFGLAKPADPVSFKTQVGRVLGTPRYMAPEMLNGSEADARSDQYAFGVTAYELIAGKHPGGVLGANAPEPLSALVKDAPRDLVAIVAKTMAVRPEDRYPSMDEVATAIDDVRAGRRPRIGGLAAFASTVASGAASRVADTVRDDGLHDKIIAQESEDADAGEPTQSLAQDASPALAERIAAHARAHGAARTLLSKEAPSGVIEARDAALAAARQKAAASGPPPPSNAPPARTMPSASPPANALAGMPRVMPGSSAFTPAPAVYSAEASPAARGARGPWVALGIAAVLALAAGGFLGTYFALHRRVEAPPATATATASATATATATASASASATASATATATAIPSAAEAPIAVPTSSTRIVPTGHPSTAPRPRPAATPTAPPAPHALPGF